ncbi:MAG TPA: TIGR01777 family oxidoreductase [Terriglobales bacterium]
MARGKVLVSGASGPVGAALIPKLREQGYEVVRLVRRSPSGEGQIRWDPTQPIDPGLVAGFEAVIHLAGETIVGRWTESKKRRIQQSRAEGTRNLAAALAKAIQKPRVFVSASAIGFYGSRGDETLREGSSSGHDFLSAVCRDWEANTQAAAQSGIRTLQTRFGLILSSDGGALPKMLPPFRMGLGGTMGNGRQWWSWIHIADVVGAILYLIENASLQGPVNFVAPNPVTNAVFTKTLASVLHRPGFFPVPAFAARLVFGQMADELLLSSQRVEPAKLMASGFQFEYTDLGKAFGNLLGHG